MNYTDKDVQDIVDTQVELKIKELKQALNEIKEYINIHKLDHRENTRSLIYSDDILQIIDKYLEVNNDTKN